MERSGGARRALAPEVRGVNREHVDLLRCPDCAGRLRLTTDEPGREVKEGRLECDACAAEYPVRGGIPRLVPKEAYTASFGFQWLRHARTQLDSETGVPISAERFFDVTAWPRRMDGERILEVGGGAGRFTEVAAATGATVVSVDYSRAVEANHAANGRAGNVLIAQADLFRMPVEAGSFARVYCFGVLQHTPDPAAAFRALLPPLAPGGELAVDVYDLTWWRYLVMTHYWVRPLTRRLPPELLYRMCRAYVERLWEFSRLVHRLPAGRGLNQALLIPDYRGKYDLPDDVLREWAILDTFDHLSPRYDKPQRLAIVRQWFEEAGLVDVDVRRGHNGIQARGRKPVATT